MKIRKILLLISIMAFVAFSAQSQEPGVHRFTLRQCLEYAWEHNQNVIIANLETEVARAKTGEFISAGLPQIDATASVNKNFILRRTFLPADQLDPTAPEDQVIELVFGTPYDGDIGLNINQMVFNGSYFVGLRASKVYQKLSVKDHIKSRIDVTENVTKAYYTVLVNQMSYETVEANYNRIDSLLRETKIMYENGFAELLDLNRTKVEFNNITTARTNAKRAVEISEDLLKFQMGMPIEDKLIITEKLSDLQFNVQEEIDMGYSFARRIEYSRLETSQELAWFDMKNDKAQYLPKLDLYLAWGMNAGVRNFGDLGQLGNRMVWPDYQLAGLRLSIPIFDGLYKAKVIQQKKLKIEQLEYQRMMLENSIKLEVEQSRKKLIMNLDELKSQEANMKLAESVYNQTKIKYQEGVGSNLEVIDADNAFKRAQNNYFNALFDALIAHVEYRKALGILEQDIKQ